jgi:hypothetical protein
MGGMDMTYDLSARAATRERGKRALARRYRTIGRPVVLA